MKKEEENQPRRNNPYIGFLVGMLIIMILNGLVFPKILQQQIIDTDYGSFIGMVEDGKIKQVKVEENRIYFSAVNDQEKESTYQTGTINDPELVDRLLNAHSPNESGKIIFTQSIPRENLPLLNFLLMWVLPGVLFYLLWKQMGKMMQSRMGGGADNVMSFGKSGAKIYADAEIKTTFADVAGQDEAKETLSG